ncbi:WD40-repeat-containing domain protein [Lyophyllum atratum]|nr:WD40-repeat-containing domain protein [Lyophyllum atratum]
MTTATKYELAGELKGANGAMNALVFSHDGALLFGGGDDGCVTVWNTETLQREQVLHDPQWGQVTALTFLHFKPPVDEEGFSLCVGTGRGYLSIYPKSKNSHWFQVKEANTIAPFKCNDGIECQAFDPLNRRLVVASHAGTIHLYDVRDRVQLTRIWTAEVAQGIPRGVTFFGEGKENLLIHALETGQMSCRDAQTSEVRWAKTLPGGIGNAVLSPDEKTLLVDNLSTGCFDIYRFPASTPLTSFAPKSTRHFTKQCAFGEDGRIGICGSDNGTVHIVDIVTGESMESLKLRTDFHLIQTVAAATTGGAVHFVAGGSSDAMPAIYLWKKAPPVIPQPVGGLVPSPPNSSMGISKQGIINVMFGILLVIVSSPNWVLPIWKGVSVTSTAVIRGVQRVAGASNLEPPTQLVGGPGATSTVTIVHTVIGSSVVSPQLSEGELIEVIPFHSTANRATSMETTQLMEDPSTITKSLITVDRETLTSTITVVHTVMGSSMIAPQIPEGQLSTVTPFHPTATSATSTEAPTPVSLVDVVTRVI